MAKINVGIVGWRGMVGSVLIERMSSENDFDKINAVAFTSSQKGQAAPKFSSEDTLWDAYDIESLGKMDIILTCQGGDYTKEVHPKLRASGFKGIWLDAASALRMNDSSSLVLDPLNHQKILEDYKAGTRDFIGANCTVSLMLMGLAGAFEKGLIEWVSAMTYQAASGAGAKNMKELINQMGHLYESVKHLSHDNSSDILALDQIINNELQQKNSGFPMDNFGAPLAGSLIPWIDSPMENGQTREEWKAMSEANKILGTNDQIPIDGTCVRIGAMRSHSQALTIKLRQNVALDELEAIIKESHEWLDFVSNERGETTAKLNPAHYSGTLNIGLGRLRKMNIGDGYYNAFTVGDQLLWGAAEPLRRFMNIYLNELV